MLTWLLLLAALWPLLWILRVAVVTRALLGIPIAREKVSAIPAEELPDSLRQAAVLWLRQLEQYEFRVVGGLYYEHPGLEAFNFHAILLANADGSIRAVLRPHVVASRSGECFLSLRTTAADGRELVTTSHGVDTSVPPPPAIQVEIMETALLTELLARHRERVAALGAPLWHSTDLTYIAEREQSVCDAVFQNACRSPVMVAQGDGTLRYGFVPAVRRAAWLLRDAQKRKKLVRKTGPMLKPELSEDAQAEFDYRHYRQMIALGRGKMSLRAKAAISAFSFVLFAAALAWRFSPDVAITLILALIFHEGGHLVGMWWFGYKDTQLLFLPFFGGAAVGHDETVLPPWKHIVIILLGPMPGIFLAIAALVYRSAYGAPDWVFEATVTVLVLNVFNLLPILPLDGGQIFDYALIARFPRIRALFLSASGIGLVLVGLVSFAGTYLAVAGVGMLLGLKTQWRLANVRRAMRDEFPDGGDEETVVRRLLVHLRGPEWAKRPLAQRLKLAQGLQQSVRSPRPGFGTIAFAIAGYTAPVWLALPLAVGLGMYLSVVKTRTVEAQAQIAEANRPAVVREVVPDEENAAVLYAQAEALSETERKAPTNEPNPEMIRLLREAAQRPKFVPAAAKASSTKAALVEEWGRGEPVDELLRSAQAQVRYGQPAGAIDQVIDGFRLIRLMDSAADWLPWERHVALVTECGDTLEAAMAAGAPISPQQAAALRALADDTTEIRYASAALPATLLRRLRAFDQLATSTNGSWLSRWLISMALTGTAKQKARMVEQATLARGYVESISRGEWPANPAKDRDISGAYGMIEELSDLIARERELRVAVSCAERHLGGALASLDALGLPAADLVHPLTRKSIQLVKRGSVHVLVVASAFGTVAGDDGGQGNLEWRLPERE